MRLINLLPPVQRYNLTQLRLPLIFRFLVNILKRLARPSSNSFNKGRRLLFLVILILVFGWWQMYYEANGHARLNIYPVGKVLLSNPLTQKTREILGIGFLFFTDKPLDDNQVYTAPSWELFFNPRAFRIDPISVSPGDGTGCNISLYRMHCSTPPSSATICQAADDPIIHIANKVHETQTKFFMREVVACNAESLTSKTDGRFMMTYLELALQVQIDRIVFHERQSDPISEALTDVLAAYQEEHLVAVDQAFEVPNDDPIFGKHAGWMEHTANVNLCYNKYRFSSEFIIFPEGYELPLPRFTGPWSRPLAVYLRQEISYRRFTSSLYVPRVKAMVDISAEENAFENLKKVSLKPENGSGLLVAISLEALGIVNNIAIPDRHFDPTKIYHTSNPTVHKKSDQIASVEFVNVDADAENEITTEMTFDEFFKNFPLNKVERRNYYFLMFRNLTKPLRKLAYSVRLPSDSQHCQVMNRNLRRFSRPHQSKTCGNLPSCHNLTQSRSNITNRYFSKGIFARLPYTVSMKKHINANQTSSTENTGDKKNATNLQPDNTKELERFRVHKSQNKTKNLQSNNAEKNLDIVIGNDVHNP